MLKIVRFEEGNVGKQSQDYEVDALKASEI